MVGVQDKVSPVQVGPEHADAIHTCQDLSPEGWVRSLALVVAVEVSCLVVEISWEKGESYKDSPSGGTELWNTVVVLQGQVVEVLHGKREIANSTVHRG